MSTIEDVLADVRLQFDTRRAEVTEYLDFLVAMDDVRANAVAHVDSAGSLVDSREMPRDLIKSLRANGFLLVYNLVEATMTAAVDAIHRCYRIDACEFGDLSDHLKRIALENFKGMIGNGSPKVLSAADPVSLAMTYLGYDKRELFSGNLDGRLIRKTVERYGFSVQVHDTALSKDGTRLKWVKEKRNELAHGSISFAECGKHVASDDMRALGQEAIAFLDATIGGLEAYVRARGYAAAAAPPAGVMVA